MNVGEFLAMTAAVVPDRVALVCGKERRTFGELEERVQRLAGALSGLGVRSGDRVATVALNGIPQVETFYACLHLEAAFVPLSYRAKAEELAQLLEDCAPALVLADDRYLATVRPLASNWGSALGS